MHWIHLEDGKCPSCCGVPNYTSVAQADFQNVKEDLRMFIAISFPVYSSEFSVSEYAADLYKQGLYTNVKCITTTAQPANPTQNPTQDTLVTVLFNSELDHGTAEAYFHVCAVALEDAYMESV